MRKIISILIIISFFQAGQAQQKPSFSSQLSAGLLEGQAGGAFHLQTLHGLRYKTWFTGAGAALDYYYLRSIPLFLSLQKDLSSKKRTFYLNLDGGTNIVWNRESGRNNFASSKYRPQLYWAGGMGYKFGLKNNDAFFVNLGYSFKHIREIREVWTFCTNPPCQSVNETYNYQLRRLLFRLGYMF